MYALRSAVLKLTVCKGRHGLTPYQSTRNGNRDHLFHEVSLCLSLVDPQVVNHLLRPSQLLTQRCRLHFQKDVGVCPSAVILGLVNGLEGRNGNAQTIHVTAISIRTTLLLPFVAPAFRQTMFNCLQDVHLREYRRDVVSDHFRVVDVRKIAHRLWRAIARLRPNGNRTDFRHVMDELHLPFFPTVPTFRYAAQSNRISLFTCSVPSHLFRSERVR